MEDDEDDEDVLLLSVGVFDWSCCVAGLSDMELAAIPGVDINTELFFETVGSIEGTIKLCSTATKGESD